MRSYRISAASGSIGAGAGTAEVFQFRWTSTDYIALIRSVRIDGFRCSTAFAAGDIDIKLVVARSWTVDGSGGTAVTVSAPNGQLRRVDPASAVGSIRISSTAGLSAGTKSVDPTAQGQILTHSSAGWNSATPIIGSIYLPNTYLLDPKIGVKEPLALFANEGIGIRFTVPATGVWAFGVTVQWDEVRNLPRD